VTAQLIDGKAIAAKLRAEVAARAAALRGRGIAPTLAVVLVGDDPASAVYVRSKTKAAREAGVEPRDVKLPETTSRWSSGSAPTPTSTEFSCKCRYLRTSTRTR
jgi:methylenetetrahydrofolate dehydrogenase (NADP+)/methenyltetrahydrofolate cyclohydrolase